MILKRHNAAVNLFVVCWSLLFFYETFRTNYLSPLAGHRLPKFTLLFPPAGWIMFFNVDPGYGFAEVYGLRNGQHEMIDPHLIFHTKAVGYDNIRRNVLVSVLSQEAAEPFCHYLKWRLPRYEAFAVVYAQYSDTVNAPDQISRHVAYRCQ